MNYKKELLRGLWAALPPESTEAGYIGVVMLRLLARYAPHGA
ncbi:hypothetical protein AK812_SmicGene47325, partial [Symbiodinium microadriaticum]